MKGKEQLQKILDAKIDSLEGICNMLDGATDWFKVYSIMKVHEEDQQEFMKTVLAYSDAYIKFIETKQAIKVLQYVLDEPITE